MFGETESGGVRDGIDEECVDAAGDEHGAAGDSRDEVGEPHKDAAEPAADDGDLRFHRSGCRFC